MRLAETQVIDGLAQQSPDGSNVRHDALSVRCSRPRSKQRRGPQLSEDTRRMAERSEAA